MSAEQGTPEWRQERAGKATASCFSDIQAKIKTGEASTRIKYRIQLVTERLTGNPVEGFTNAAMQWGIEREPEARMAYEARQGVFAEKVGFMPHPTIDRCGASPDSMVGDDGMVEIKCPLSTTHLTWMEAGVVPSEHIAQIQGQMAVAGRRWVDFVSYDPRFPEGLQLFIVRVLRDEAYIANLENEIRIFLAGVDQMVERLLKRAA